MNFKGIRRRKEIGYADVEKIEIEKIGRTGHTKMNIFNNNRKYGFSIPSYELPHVITELRLKFGRKLRENQPISFHSWGLLIVLVIFSFLVALIQGSGISEGFSLAIFLYGFLLVIFSIPITVAVFSYLPAKPTVEKVVKKEKDRSHSKPFRSVILSVFLRLVGATLFFIILLLKLYSYSAEGYKDSAPIRAIPWYIFYILIGVILSASYSLGQRKPKMSKEKSQKKPILYLRSFADDRETTLNKNSMLSYTLGVDPPYYFLEQYEIGERTWLNRFLKKLIRFLYRFHPLFLFRLMFGRPKETSEQQLGSFLKKYGNFVAIGKPGEKFVTTGAARMYVTNEEWQQTVLDLLQESTFIVLQPSRTKGVWWEVEQTFKKVSPEKILLCLVNYHGYQDDYETFRLRMEDLFPNHPALPRSIGNEPKIAFMSFNASWEPQVYYQKSYWAISWPFRGSTANLHKTLKPFIQLVKHG